MLGYVIMVSKLTNQPFRFLINVQLCHLNRVFGTALLFSSFALCYLAKRFQLHVFSSRKNGGVVRAPKEVLHKF